MNTSHTSETRSVADGPLWERVLRDETGAFEQVVEQHQGVVAAVAFNILGDFYASQDVAQETFWQAWRSRNQLHDPSRLGPWLCGIARNLSHQALSKQRRTPSLLDIADIDPESIDQDPIEISISGEERKLVWAALEDIPESYREALILFYREGQSVSEIAATLEISTDAAKQRLSRGRDRVRDHLANTVEDVLRRSRPGRAFTTRVMAGVAALSASFKAVGPASAAGLGNSLAQGTAGGVAATATKSLLAGGAGAGIVGGLLGAAGGLGGAWLGTWLPAQLAPTQAERLLLEKSGRQVWVATLIFTAAMLVSSTLIVTQIGWVPFLIVTALIGLTFGVYVLVHSMALQREIQKLRATTTAEATPNDSYLRKQWGYTTPSRYEYRGRQYTSRWRLFGVPLIDVQFSDLTGPNNISASPPRRAFGWIAVGDRATGILFAVGGIAKGLVAIGGLAIGGVAIGGLSLGIVSVAGAAIGALAIGGGAFGYDAVGGLAIGWNSATGGAAIAHHVAFGGGALAQNFAVGGGAVANQVNNEAAQAAVDQHCYYWMLQWVTDNLVLFLVLNTLISILPAVLSLKIYRRVTPP
jgi:RNA polymerase sigma factor (sigma-70 family)